MNKKTKTKRVVDLVCGRIWLNPGAVPRFVLFPAVAIPPCPYLAVCRPWNPHRVPVCTRAHARPGPKAYVGPPLLHGLAPVYRTAWGARCGGARAPVGSLAPIAPLGRCFREPKVAECCFCIMRSGFWENYILLALGAGFNANTPRVWHLSFQPLDCTGPGVCPCA